MSRYRVVNSSRSQVDGSGRLLAPAGGGSDYVLPAATRATRGGIRVGTDLTVVGDVLSAVDMRYDDTELQADVADINAQIQEIIDIIEGGGGGLEERFEELVELVDALNRDIGDLFPRVGTLEFTQNDLQQRLTDVELFKQPLLSAGDNIKTINGESILGEGNLEVSGGGSYTLPAATELVRGGIRIGERLTIDGDVLSGPEPYNDSVVLGAIMDVEEQVTNLRGDVTAIDEALSTKQDLLVSGTTIKTVNGQSLLGSGDLQVGGGGGGGGVYAAEPGTVPLRGVDGEVLGKTSTAADALINNGFYAQQMALLDTVTPQSARFSFTNRAPMISASSISKAFKATRTSPLSDNRLVEFATLRLVVDTELSTPGATILRIVAAGGSVGFQNVVTTGFAVDVASGLMVPVRTTGWSANTLNLIIRAVMPAGTYDVDFTPGVFAWTTLPV